jgi:PAS domain S-box-containing protein
MRIGKNMAPLRTTLIYALFGILWILTTDSIVEFLFSPSDPTRSLLQTIKGWLFVLLSAALIYWLLHNDLKFIEASEERYHKLFDASIDAILLTIPTGEILAANAAACRMFDLTEEEILQRGRDGIVDVTDPRLALALEERARTGRFSGELTLVRGDGSKFLGEVSTAKYKDRDGNELTSMIIRDVSERKQAKEESS